MFLYLGSIRLLLLDSGGKRNKKFEQNLVVLELPHSQSELLDLLKTQAQYPKGRPCFVVCTWTRNILVCAKN